jgi:hypothetical protein
MLRSPRTVPKPGMLDRGGVATRVEDVTFTKLVSNRWLRWHDDGESESVAFAGAVFTAVTYSRLQKIEPNMLFP